MNSHVPRLALLDQIGGPHLHVVHPSLAARSLTVPMAATNHEAGLGSARARAGSRDLLAYAIQILGDALPSRQRQMLELTHVLEHGKDSRAPTYRSAG